VLVVVASSPDIFGMARMLELLGEGRRENLHIVHTCRVRRNLLLCLRLFPIASGWPVRPATIGAWRQDLIILDLSTPVMNGLDASNRINHVRSLIRV
jgi:CheY-like chemotaxis protein